MTTHTNEMEEKPKQAFQYDLAFMERFCSQSESNKKFHFPFKFGGWIYACNGNLAIRIKDEGLLPAFENSKVGKELSKLFMPDSPDNIPLLELPEAIKCDMCSGTGVRYKDDCSDCDGEGAFVHGSHTYVCLECHGDGTAFVNHPTSNPCPCFDCSGRGEIDYQPINIRGTKFNRYLLALIVELPCVRITHLHPCRSHTQTIATKFEFDGGEGLIMPCR